MQIFSHFLWNSEFFKIGGGCCLKVHYFSEIHYCCEFFIKNGEISQLGSRIFRIFLVSKSGVWHNIIYIAKFFGFWICCEYVIQRSEATKNPEKFICLSWIFRWRSRWHDASKILRLKLQNDENLCYVCHSEGEKRPKNPEVSRFPGFFATLRMTRIYVMCVIQRERNDRRIQRFHVFLDSSLRSEWRENT
jgi:hypothetical protein